MKTSASKIKDKYKKLTDDEIIALYVKNDLIEVARPILIEEIIVRGLKKKCDLLFEENRIKKEKQAKAKKRRTVLFQFFAGPFYWLWALFDFYAKSIFQ